MNLIQWFFASLMLCIVASTMYYINCIMLKVLIAKTDSKWESHADDKVLKKERINSI